MALNGLQSIISGNENFGNTQVATYLKSTNGLVSNTDAMFFPSGTTEQRPANPLQGMVRFNTTRGEPEYYSAVNNQWASFASSTTGDFASNTYVNSRFTTVQNTFMIIAASDETSTITAGTNKIRFRAPFAMTLWQIPRATLSTASSSGAVTVDINEDGTSILGANKITIDALAKTSRTATTPTTLADTAIADDAEISIDIDGAGTSAAGLKVILYYSRT